MAIEVELSQKSYEEIESVANFYSEEGKNADVLWVVSSKSQADKTYKKICDVTKSNDNSHSFLLLSDFLKSNWQSTFVIGKHKGKSVLDLVGSSSETSWKIASKNLYFVTQKMRINSVPNQKIDSLKFLIAGSNPSPSII